MTERDKKEIAGFTADVFMATASGYNVDITLERLNKLMDANLGPQGDADDYFVAFLLMEKLSGIAKKQNLLNLREEYADGKWTITLVFEKEGVYRYAVPVSLEAGEPVFAKAMLSFADTVDGVSDKITETVPGFIKVRYFSEDKEKRRQSVIELADRLKNFAAAFRKEVTGYGTFV